MKKIILAFSALLSLTVAVAQAPKTKKNTNLTSTSGDHVVLQLSADFWGGVPDSIKTHQKSLSRGANIYFMLNKPFKSNPSYSVAFGAGVGTSSMYFKNYNVNIKSTATKLPFSSLDSTDRFKKYKLTTAYLEIPIEFRYTKDPSNPNKSFKAAIGVKVGTLVNVHTKGKTLQNKSGTTINTYTEKETNKRYFNGTRIAATARVGYGIFSVFGSYQLTNLLKDGVGPDLKPFQVGICISGL